MTAFAPMGTEERRLTTTESPPDEIKVTIVYSQNLKNENMIIQRTYMYHNT